MVLFIVFSYICVYIDEVEKSEWLVVWVLIQYQFVIDPSNNATKTGHMQKKYSHWQDSKLEKYVLGWQQHGVDNFCYLKYLPTIALEAFACLFSRALNFAFTGLKLNNAFVAFTQ